MFKKIIFFFLFVVILAFSASANAQILVGRIIDAQTKMSLEGVSINVKGTLRTTLSSQEGHFRLNLYQEDNSVELIFSRLGYITQTVPIKGFLRDIKISLVPKPILLNEVIVKNLTIDAKGFLKRALINAPGKLHQEPKLFTAFYNEALYKNENLERFTEAQIQTIKNSYHYPSMSKVYILKKSSIAAKHNKLDVDVINGVSMIQHNDLLLVRDSLFNPDFFDKYKFTYQSTVDDDFIAIGFSTKASLKMQKEGYVLVHKKDTAIVKIELKKKEKSKESIITTASYKLLNGRYYLSSISKIARKGDTQINADLIVTNINDSLNFLKSEIYERNTSLTKYESMPRDSFWRGVDFRYTDSVLYSKIANLQAESQNYIPVLQVHNEESTNITLIMPVKPKFDALHINKNFNQIDRLLNSVITRRINSGVLSSLAQLFTPILITNPLRNVISEYSYLGTNSIRSKVSFTLINKYTRSHVYNISNEQLNKFKIENQAGLIRFYMLRNENNYLAVNDLEEEMFVKQIDRFEKKNLFLNIYFSDIFNRRLTQVGNLLFPNFSLFNVKTGSFIGNDLYSYIYYLHRKNQLYVGGVEEDMLNNKEADFIKRVRVKSLINLISPFIVASRPYELGINTSFKFSLNYALTPFGEQYAENFYVKHNNQKYAILLKQYQNYYKVGFGVSLKHYQYPIFNKVTIDNEISYFKQPKTHSFYDEVFSDGFSCQQLLRYEASNKFQFLLGFLAKSRGYLMESYSLNGSFSAFVGLKVEL